MKTLHSIPIFNAVGICFQMILQFLKVDILSPWKNSNPFLISFIKMSVCTLLFCNNILTSYVASAPAVLVRGLLSVYLPGRRGGEVLGMDNQAFFQHRAQCCSHTGTPLSLIAVATVPRSHQVPPGQLGT